MKNFARKQTSPEFFKPLDVARRIAGTGSLGLERYVILVEGRESPDGNVLLDLKYQPAPALAPYLKLPQPHWKSEVERVIGIQRRAQAIARAFLTAVKLGRKSFMLKEAQPTSDKVDLVGWQGTIEDLRRLVHTMGQLVAWSHLRASGREGSAIADQFIDFGEQNRWRRELLELAEEMAPRVEEDWRTSARRSSEVTVGRMRHGQRALPVRSFFQDDRSGHFIMASGWRNRRICTLGPTEPEAGRWEWPLGSPWSTQRAVLGER